MGIRVNGKEMKDAVIKTDQYEMRILELTPESMKVSIRATGDAFNFVPRFFTIFYPDSKLVNAKDTGAIVAPAKETVQTTILFSEKLRLERMMSFELRYARKRLAEISID
jgi:hypothetical protein